MTIEYARRHFPALCRARAADSHKGTYGAVAVIGGAPGMTGAALLAGRAALYQGAGKVYIGFAQSVPLPIDVQQPELMLGQADELLQRPGMTAYVAGVGMGLDQAALALLQRVFKASAAMPLVLDADGLTLLARGQIKPGQRQGPLVMTPHPLEAARLLGWTAEQVQQARPRAAVEISKKYGAWTVLKGHKTVIATPTGDTQTNPTGNPGLASGGTGDVLAGMIGACLAQGLPVAQAVPGAVWLHGAAADQLAAEGTGPIGMTASEVLLAARHLRNRLGDTSA